MRDKRLKKYEILMEINRKQIFSEEISNKEIEEAVFC